MGQKKHDPVNSGYYVEAYDQVMAAIKTDLDGVSKIILIERLLQELELNRPTPVEMRYKMVRKLKSEQYRILYELGGKSN